MLSYKKIIFYMAGILSCYFVSVAYSFWSETLTITPIPPTIQKKIVLSSGVAIEPQIEREVIQEDAIAGSGIPETASPDIIENTDRTEEGVSKSSNEMEQSEGISVIDESENVKTDNQENNLESKIDTTADSEENNTANVE